MSFTKTKKNNKIGEQITKEAVESPLKISKVRKTAILTCLNEARLKA